MNQQNQPQHTPDAAERAARKIAAMRTGCQSAIDAISPSVAAIIREEYAGELAALEADKRELVYTLGALTGTYDDVINGLGIIGGEEMILEQSRAVLAKHGGR